MNSRLCEHSEAIHKIQTVSMFSVTHQMMHELSTVSIIFTARRIDGTISAHFTAIESFMFGKPNPVFEKAALTGNIDLMKNLIAMSAHKPSISGETLVELFMRPLKDSNSRQMHDMAIYLMKHVNWDVLDLENCLIKLLPSSKSLLDCFYAIKHDTASNLIADLLTLPQIASRLRENFIEDDLIVSIEDSDIDDFLKKFSKYFAKNSRAKELIDFLPEKILSSLHCVLSEHDFLNFREFFVLSEHGFEDIILSNIIERVPTDNAIFLAKFIELGINNLSFKLHVGKSIDEWCRENHCLDLLDIESVQRTIVKTNLYEAITVLQENRGTCENYNTQFEGMVIDYLTKFYTNDIENGALTLTLYGETTNYLWEFAAQTNMVNLLKYPGILPTENTSKLLNKAILDAAKKGYTSVVDILIDHARAHAPDALRFLDADLKDIPNKIIVKQLQHAFVRKESSSFIDYVLSGLSLFLPEPGGEDESDNDNEDQDGLNLEIIL